MKQASRRETQPTGYRNSFAAPTSFWHGVLEGALLTAAFVVTGLAWAAIEADLAPRNAAAGVEPSSHKSEANRRGPELDYRGQRMENQQAAIWLVDGYNVLHACVLGGRDRSEWWTESHRNELIEKIRSFDDPTAEIWVVFDGPDDPQQPADRSPRCVFAVSADEWLVDRVRQAEDPSAIAVVTADRQVAGRVQHRGAQIVSPKNFLARCTG